MDTIAHGTDTMVTDIHTTVIMDMVMDTIIHIILTHITITTITTLIILVEAIIVLKMPEGMFIVDRVQDTMALEAHLADLLQLVLQEHRAQQGRQTQLRLEAQEVAEIVQEQKLDQQTATEAIIAILTELALEATDHLEVVQDLHQGITDLLAVARGLHLVATDPLEAVPEVVDLEAVVDAN